MSTIAKPSSRAPTVPNAGTEFRARLQVAVGARARVLERLDTDRIVAALAHAAGEWTAPHSAVRVEVAAELGRVTGLHPGMLDAGLELVFGAVTEASLRDLLAREARGRRAHGPETVFYALAGNVPGQAIPAIVACQLARSIAVLRDSARQPLVTEAFRVTVARVEPDLAEMIVPVAWSSHSPSSDERELESFVLDAAARIELFGSDAIVTTLSRRYREASKAKMLAHHGTRMSAGIVAPGADLEHAAEAFACDVVMYEGRGCLTPHTLLVEGAPVRAEDFAERLARHLETLERRWPRAHGSLAEEAARRAFIDRAEVSALGGGATVHGDSKSRACVRVDGGARAALGPGLRCVVVLPSRDRGATLRALAAASTPLAACGLSGDSDVPSKLAPELAALGSILVLPAGRMQAPPIHWEQDGRRRLAELLESP